MVKKEETRTSQSSNPPRTKPFMLSHTTLLRLPQIYHLQSHTPTPQSHAKRFDGISTTHPGLFVVLGISKQLLSTKQAEDVCRLIEFYLQPTS